MTDEATLDAELESLVRAGRAEPLAPAAKQAVRAAVARRVALPSALVGGAVVSLALVGAVLWGLADEGTVMGTKREATPPTTAVGVADPSAPGLRAEDEVVRVEDERALPFVGEDDEGAADGERAVGDDPRGDAVAPRRERSRADRARSATPREPVGEPAPSVSSTLQEEVELLTRAHQALEARSPRDALAALDAHAARFPDGVLRLDREAARWVARCALNPTVHAGGRAFAARHSRVPLAERVRAACRPTSTENP